LSCDAFALERAYAGDAPTVVENMYCGDFLADFQIGSGAEEFDVWAEQRRARYRSMALHVFEGLGAQAESGGRWPEALELGRRAIEIEALYEAGHRRIMRALTALGERGLALNHYGELALWLQQRVQLQPDPATTQLATELRQGLSPTPAVPLVANPISNQPHGAPTDSDGVASATSVFKRVARAFGNRPHHGGFPAK
jgi:DNA-binding SARP family transcriptional activator